MVGAEDREAVETLVTNAERRVTESLNVQRRKQETLMVEEDRGVGETLVTNVGRRVTKSLSVQRRMPESL